MNNDYYNNNIPYNPEPQTPPVPPQAPQANNGYVPPQAPQAPIPQAPQPQQIPQAPIPQAPQPQQIPQAPIPPAPQVQPQVQPEPPQAPIQQNTQAQTPVQPESQPAPVREPVYYNPQQPPVQQAQAQQPVQPQYNRYRSPYQPQKQPMSAGLKVFLTILITFLVLSFAGFVVFITAKPADNGFVEESTAPSTPYSFTVPTQPSTEAPSDDEKEYPESDAQNATDPSYKGLKTENKPKKINANQYGSAYAFEKVEKSVVGIIGYGDGQEGNEKSYLGMGSGVVISSDGYIVTNSHIVNHSRTAYKLKVITSDKKEYKAGVVGYDSRNDIAVLKVNAKGLTPATFGNSDQLKVTEDIIVVGNPLGLNYQNSVTKGIVSALNREVLSSNNAKVIQTDAAINPGNSGGPMVNMYGQVVGVATAKIVLDDYEGMAFAIPGNTVKKIVDSIIRDGYVKGRVKIGIIGRAVKGEQADVSGIQIEEIVKGGPMENKGVKTGDIMTKVDGKDISTFSEVYTILENHKAGDKIKVKLYRPDTEEKFDVEITLQEDKAE